MKEWQAFRDLKKTIDDFAETCPLLHMMANKVRGSLFHGIIRKKYHVEKSSKSAIFCGDLQAMLPRHWSRLSELTGHSLQVESESFSLRNIMEAPLLKHKEDIEVLP